MAHQGTSDTSGLRTMRPTVEAPADPVAGSLAPGGRPRWRVLVPWAAGVLLALALLGPALAPGAMFNLDLVLSPASPVPRGVWGLGPELPRRVPIWLVVGWLAPIVGGDTVAKLFMVACIAGAFAGAYRLTRGALEELAASEHAPRTPAWAAPLVATAAGLLYAANPFLLTRLAIGHLMIAVPMAVLPWVVRRLLRPGDDIARTFLAILALSIAGHYGGVIAGIFVTVGIVRTRGHKAVRVVGVTALAQVSWLVPGLVVYLQGTSIADATPFAVFAPTPADVVRVLGGHGFYDPAYQVGYPGGWPVLAASLVLVALAVYGTSRLPDRSGPALAIVAALGFLIAIGTAVPGLSSVSVWMSRTAVGSVLREGQRALPLYLLWAAPAAALGAHRLAWRRPSPRREAAVRSGGAAWVAAPFVVAVVLAAPGVWGIDAHLRAVAVPEAWAATRDAVRADPGTVLALPWHQYLELGGSLDLDDGAGGPRRSLGPMPLFLGGDVMTSSDPEVQDNDRRERLDPREGHVVDLLARLRAGEPVAAALGALGIRWVVVQHDEDWARYRAVNDDPGLERVVAGDGIDLYRVASWPGTVTAEDGRVLPATEVVEPLLLMDPSGPATYARPYAGGWLRGWSPAGESPQGTIALPAGSGPIWYWPSLLVLLAYAVTVAATIVAIRRVQRESRAARTDVTAPTGTDPPAPA